MKNYLFRKHPLFCLFFATALSLSAFAQDNITVRGTVTDATGEALIGVSITHTGSGNGTVTDIDGQFTMNVPQGVNLRFTYVGYETLELAAQPSMNVRLQESVNLLDEIVVIGYGTQRRGDLTTAISTVSTKDIEHRPIVSAGQAIQGKAAGVMVMQPNGSPGADLTIRVRGTTSFNASNDPLYVVDGVPVDNLKFLAPNDIATMQILKDASSAAIYGSRAANGVILITTKAGTINGAKITFNAQYGLNRLANEIQPLNAAQYQDLMGEIFPIGLVPAGDVLTDKTDWYDEAYTTGTTQNYQVSVSDGTDRLKYYLSAGYLDEKGILKAAYYKRYNFRANVDNQIRKWLNVNASITYSDYTGNGLITGQGANRAGVVLSVINTPTYAPVWDTENPTHYFNNFYGMREITNPIENMARTNNNANKENRLIASGSALITFIPDLTLKSSLTLDRRNALITTFLDPVSTDYGRTQNGTASDERNMNTLWVFDNVLAYQKNFNKHKIEAMAGSSWTDSDYRNSWINASGYKDDQIQTLNAANKIAWDNTGTGASQWSILSYFGRIAYNFDSKYLLTANVRTDISSKLHPDHRQGTFPSFSAAWRMSSEEFMNGLDWLDDLKIRAGWGQTGNQSGVGDYAYLQRYNINRVRWWETGNDLAVPYLTPANIRTPDLRWETTSQTDIGLDVTLLKNRLTLVVDYYFKRTTDMLMYVSLPPGNLADNIVRNEGEMTNKGFEFAFNSRNLQGAFSWDTEFNISFNKNKLEKLELQKIYYADSKTSDQVQENVVRNEPGRSLGGFFGYISDGVDPETGDLIYRDINKDGRISSTDRTYIGDPNPDFTYGLTNNFSWKNFDLSIFIQGSYGNDIFNASRMETEGMYDAKNQSVRVLDRWRVPGQQTDVPKAHFSMKNSSYFVEDGSYLRVKTVSLSYNFTGGILKKWGITRLQPYFSANNLLTWTKYSGMDPEVNQWGNSGSVQGIDWGTYPHSKSYVLGVNVEF